MKLPIRLGKLRKPTLGALAASVLGLLIWMIWIADIPGPIVKPGKSDTAQAPVTEPGRLRVRVLLANGDFQAVALKAAAGLCLGLLQKESGFLWRPVPADGDVTGAGYENAPGSLRGQFTPEEFEAEENAKREFVYKLWWDLNHPSSNGVAERSILIQNPSGSTAQRITFTFGTGEDFEFKGPLAPRYLPLIAACNRLKEADVVFGPTATPHVKRLLQLIQQNATARPTGKSNLPRGHTQLILSPTATTSQLTPSAGVSPHPRFLRWMTPNSELANRLAREVALGLRPRRMALIYASDPSARGLRDDFVQALKDFQFPKHVRWSKPQYTAEVEFPRGIWHAAQIKARREQDGRRPLPSSEEPDAEQKAREDFLEQLPAHLLSLRNERIGALCVFGTTEDKLYLIPLIQQYLPRIPILTTHADVGLEQLSHPRNVWVVSAMHIRSVNSGADLQEAQNFVMPRLPRRQDQPIQGKAESGSGRVEPPIYPDVYMLSSEQAALFMFRLLAASKSGSELQKNLDEHLSGVVPHPQAPVFSQSGDRVLRREQLPQLLLLTNRGLETAEFSRYYVIGRDQVIRHPVLQYALLCIFIWTGVGVA